MDVREKLVEIIQNSVGGCARHWAEVIADGLIAHGVTVQEWISTDKRMPMQEDAATGYVFTAYKNKNCYDVNISLWDIIIAYPDLYDYWMPLPMPEPPKGE